MKTLFEQIWKKGQKGVLGTKLEKSDQKIAFFLARSYRSTLVNIGAQGAFKKL